MMNCTEIMEYINKASTDIFTCNIEGDYLRINTPFYYPDGDLIELFIQKNGENIILSDLSETYRFLNTYAIDISNSHKRTEILDSVTNNYNIRLNNGTLYAIVKNPKMLLQAIMNLSQAVIRVTDIIYTIRRGATDSFKEEVSDMLEVNNVNFEVDYPVKTPVTESNYTFDFAIETANKIRLMNLATTSRPDIKPSIDKLIKTWFDIQNHLLEEYPIENRITLLNDVSYEWKENDYLLLKELSEVYKWTEREKLVSLLTA